MAMSFSVNALLRDSDEVSNYSLSRSKVTSQLKKQAPWPTTLDERCDLNMTGQLKLVNSIKITFTSTVP
jgi:hypothetical protein